MKTHATSFNQSFEKQLAYSIPIIAKTSFNLNIKLRKEREGFFPGAARRGNREVSIECPMTKSS